MQKEKLVRALVVSVVALVVIVVALHLGGAVIGGIGRHLSGAGL